MAPQQAKSRQRQIMAEIAKIGFCLPGSLVQRTTRCGTRAAVATPTPLSATAPTRLGPAGSAERPSLEP